MLDKYTWKGKKLIGVIRDLDEGRPRGSITLTANEVLRAQRVRVVEESRNVGRKGQMDDTWKQVQKDMDVAVERRNDGNGLQVARKNAKMSNANEINGDGDDGCDRDSVLFDHGMAKVGSADADTSSSTAGTPERRKRKGGGFGKRLKQVISKHEKLRESRFRKTLPPRSRERHRRMV